MPPKLKCFTKTTTKEKPPRKYTTCVGGTSKAKEEPKKKKKIKFKVKEKKTTHTMPNGSVMTGATHSASSKPVKKIKFKVKKTEAPPAEKVSPKKIKFKVKAKPAPAKPAPAKKLTAKDFEEEASKSARDYLDTLKADKSKIKPSTKNRNEMTAKDFEIERLMKRDEEIQRVEKLSSAEKNKLDPAKLFGILPQELRKKILDPKQTGVKVAQGLQSMEKDADKLDAKLKELRQKHSEFSVSYSEDKEAMAKKLFKEKTRKELIKMYKEDYTGGVSGISTSTLARKVALFATPFPKRIDELNNRYRKISEQVSDLRERIFKKYNPSSPYGLV